MQWGVVKTLAAKSTISSLFICCKMSANVEILIEELKWKNILKSLYLMCNSCFDYAKTSIKHVPCCLYFYMYVYMLYFTQLKHKERKKMKEYRFYMIQRIGLQTQNTEDGNMGVYQ